METENKSGKSKVGVLKKIIILIILAPFIYPLILRVFVKLGFFCSVEQYLEYMLPFSNKYTLLVVIILLVLIFLIFVEKFDNIKDFFMGFDFKF